MSSSKNPLKQFLFGNYERFSTFLVITSMLVAIFALILQVILKNGFDSDAFKIEFGNPMIDPQIEILKKEIISIKDEQAKLNSQIDNMTKVPDQVALSAEVIEIKNTLSNLDNRFSRIENLLVQNPEKALEVPLIRKDLDNLILTTDMQIALLRQDVERSYNLMLVTIVALTIAVLAPALGNLGNLFKKEESEKKEKEE